MTTSKNGMEEMNAANNHGTCWLMQVAAFAHLHRRRGPARLCAASDSKKCSSPDRLAADGSLPLEMRRTKPYGYCLFNARSHGHRSARSFARNGDNLWEFTTAGRPQHPQGVEYIHPYIKDKSTWPHKPDVMFWEFWPVRSPVLLFGGLAYQRAQVAGHVENIGSESNQ